MHGSSSPDGPRPEPAHAAGVVPAHVRSSRQIVARTSCTRSSADRPAAGLDVRRPRFGTTLVLIGDLAPLGRLQHPHEAVGVAGEVGEHVANGPAGKQRRQADVGVAERVDVREQPLVGGCTSGDLVVEVSCPMRPRRRTCVGSVGPGRPMGNDGGDADRHGRTRTDGRQHGAPASRRRPRVRGVRRDGGADRGARGRGGAAGAAHARALVAALEPPRTIWLMVPAALVGDTVVLLSSLLSPRRHDHRRRQLVVPPRRRPVTALAASGHPLPRHRHERRRPRPRAWVLPDDRRRRRGGRRLAPIFDTLAPGVDTAERTPGRDGRPAPEERGWLHCGPSGAGHFVKMVHNGIEYGLMAAYAEGPQRAGQGEHRCARTTGRRRDGAARRSPSTTSTTSTCRRSPRCGGEARRSLVAARPDRRRRCTPTPQLDEYSGRRQRLR